MDINVNLKNIEIENYKSIYETKLDINDRITVVAGKNESGKTNILKALYDSSKDSFNDDCKPLGFEKSNPKVNMNFEFLGAYLNKAYKNNIFNAKEIYSFNISRSMNEIDTVSGTAIDEIGEYLKKYVKSV